MSSNPILDELHAVRERLLADAGGTLDALVNRLQTEEQDSLRPRYKTRRIGRCTGTTNSDESPIDNFSSPPGER